MNNYEFRCKQLEAENEEIRAKHKTVCRANESMRNCSHENPRFMIEPETENPHKKGDVVLYDFGCYRGNEDARVLYVKDNGYVNVEPISMECRNIIGGSMMDHHTKMKPREKQKESK